MQQHAAMQASATHPRSTADSTSGSNGCQPQQSPWHSSSPAGQALAGVLLRIRCCGSGDGGGAALSTAAGRVQAFRGSQQAAAVPLCQARLSLLLVAVLGSSYDSEMSDAEPRPGQHTVSQHQVVDMVPDSAPAAMAQARPGRCWTWSC